jgi:hypothetical protein
VRGATLVWTVTDMWERDPNAQDMAQFRYEGSAIALARSWNREIVGGVPRYQVERHHVVAGRVV